MVRAKAGNGLVVGWGQDAPDVSAVTHEDTEVDVVGDNPNHGPGTPGYRFRIKEEGERGKESTFPEIHPQTRHQGEERDSSHGGEEGSERASNEGEVVGRGKDT